ncbi:hypothetical protein CLOM_g17487 [Closterium sp. NIES-68]|nr:hypothetical protein CLOM_g17487 [Closterium sp. NIES-68]GJP86508.1 hypothetical protein CLOP_g16527 [Closterium sp. NIES-67]
MATTKSKAAFILLLCIVAHATAAGTQGSNQGGGTDNRSCPIFQCQSKSKKSGRFDSVNPKFSEAFTYSATKDPNEECWKVCQYHNQGNRPDPVVYWQYEPFTDPTTGGLCTCYGEEVCKDKHFIDPARDNGVRPEFIYVGKICPANGTGDPHFVGADSSRFDFSGRPGEDYALISDAHVAVQAHFDGRWGKWEGRNKALTWMRQISILWGHHTIVFEARTGWAADYRTGYLQRLVVDSEEVKLGVPGSHLESASFFDGQVDIKWAAAKKVLGDDLVDEYEVRIGDILALRLTLRPEIAMLRTEDDGLVHFTVDVMSAKLSPNVHGVLGQTYRPDFAGRLGKQKLVYSELFKTYVVPGDNAEGFIDGTVDDYKCSDLTHSDCTFCRFVRAEGLDDETALAVEMATGVSSSYSNNGRDYYPRKALVGAF